MRTAVVRVDVDPTGELTSERLADGMAVLKQLAAAAGMDVVDVDLAAMPPRRRQVQLLMAGSAPDVGVALCARAFGTAPELGVVTYVSRGTDDDAHGVLARFGMTGEVAREPGPEGFDIVTVTVAEVDLERIPESRIHTALEASLNCEVHVRAV